MADRSISAFAGSRVVLTVAAPTIAKLKNTNSCVALSLTVSMRCLVFLLYCIYQRPDLLLVRLMLLLDGVQQRLDTLLLFLIDRIDRMVCQIAPRTPSRNPRCCGTLTTARWADFTTGFAVQSQPDDVAG
jgi:hypothetical protein